MVGPMAGTAGEMEEVLPCWGLDPPTATGGAALDAIGGDEIFLVALAYELRAVGCCADPAATLDGPDEEAAAGVEAAIGGFCVVEAGALIRTRGVGRGKSSVVVVTSSTDGKTMTLFVCEQRSGAQSQTCLVIAEWRWGRSLLVVGDSGQKGDGLE